MLFKTVALSLLLGAVTATTLNERFVDDALSAVVKRQLSKQFVPGTQTATGDTCAVAFGSGYVTCREISGTQNRLCYNPNVGQTCCSTSWACPNGSFCLTAGYCCPGGSDAQSCANANSVSLPSDYATPSATAKPTSNSSSNGYGYPTTSSSSSKKSSSKKSSSTSSYVVPTSYAKNVTSTGTLKTTGTATAPKATSSPFTAGASNLEMSFTGLMVAGFVGFAAMF